MTDLASDTDAIQRDLDRTRARMDDRLNQLENKLTPGQIMDELMGFVRGNDASVFTQDLMNSVKGNPLPAALTGIGLAWLMASNNRPATSASASTTSSVSTSTSATSYRPQGRTASPSLPWTTSTDFDSHLGRVDAATTRNASEDEPSYNNRLNEARGRALGIVRREDETHESFGSRVSHMIESTRQSITEAAHDVTDRLASTASQVGQSVQSAVSGLTGSAQNVSQSASQLMSSVTSNPVLLGAFGLAVGAILGTIVPQSEQEANALKGVADSVRDTASGLAQKAADKGSELAQAGLDAAQDVVKDAKLGGDMPVKELLREAQSGELVDSIKKVATEALGAVGDKTSGSSSSGASSGSSSSGMASSGSSSSGSSSTSGSSGMGSSSTDSSGTSSMGSSSPGGTKPTSQT